MKKILILLLLLLLIGCKQQERIIEVPVPQIKVEYREKLQVDTLIRNDSVIIRELGDTCIIEKYKYLYKVKLQTDTINITDTITVVQTVQEVKEVNKIKNWQIILMVLGGVAVAFGLYKAINIIRKWIQGL